MARPATAGGTTEWLPLPEGMWRMEIGDPTIKEKVSQWGAYPELTFPLTLTEGEQARLKDHHGEPAEGQQQSYRLWIRGKEATSCGFYRNGKYEQTDCGLAQLMCAAVGAKHARQLRDWMSKGGAPTMEDQDELISWYSWFTGLEVYVQVRHDPDKVDPHKVWPRATALLPVGSIPGQPEPEYQQATANKVRTMISIATPAEPAPKAAPTPAEAPARTYEDLFGDGPKGLGF